MMIHPIRNEEEYEQTLAEIETLWGTEPGTPEADRMDVLVLLVEAYEQVHHPIAAPDPIELILYVMEARGLTRRELEPCLGSRARVSEVLNRRRPLSLDMIRNLQAKLGLPAEALIQPYALNTATRPRGRQGRPVLSA